MEPAPFLKVKEYSSGNCTIKKYELIDGGYLLYSEECTSDEGVGEVWEQSEERF